MRLSTKERQSLRDAVAAVLGDAGWELLLHGSRVKDESRGGDIDLLLVCGSAAVLDEAKRRKRTLLVEIESRIGERRVDVTVTSSDPIEQSHFVQTALTGAIAI